MIGHFRQEGSLPREPLDRCCQTFWIARRNDKAVVTVRDYVAAVGRRYHGQAVRHRLELRQRETVREGRESEDVSALVERPDAAAWYPAQELHVRRGAADKLAGDPDRAGEDEFHVDIPQQARRGHQILNAFAQDQAAYPED